MHRNFYFFGIFFLILAFLASIFMSILFFQIGYRTYQLEAYASWFWIEVALSLTIAVVLLYYYKHKAYRFTYKAAFITIIASILRYFTAYLFVVLMMREVMTFYIISVVVSILTGMLYAISLLISKAGKNIWLKTEGILLLIVGLASSFVIIWSLSLLGLQNNADVEIVTQWINLGACLAPIPLIILFYQEYQHSSSEQEVSGKFKYEDLRYAFSGLLTFTGLVVGATMSTQMRWYTHTSPEEQALVNRFESKTYEDNKGNTLDYLLMKPLDYDTTRTYPLVICLHGGPQSAKTERVWVTEPAPLLSKPVNRKKYPAFLFVPQAPPALSWGGTPYVQSIDSLLMGSIQALEKTYAIDEKRIYLTGISMGGYGTWYLMGTRPDIFAAGIPMCGAGDPSLAPDMADIPIWAFHGSEDKNVPVKGSRDMIAAIKQAGGNPKYTEFPDVAHHVWPHVNATPGVLDWLFAQSKE